MMAMAQHSVPGVTFADDPSVVYVSAGAVAGALHIPLSHDSRSDLTFLGSIPLDYESAVGNQNFVRVDDLKSLGAEIQADSGSVRVSLNGESVEVHGGRKTVIVDKGMQIIRIFQGHNLLLTSPVCTGKYPRSTPDGTFVVGGVKDAFHSSSKYGEAPMPWAVQVTGAIYIHGGPVLDRPSSHGCIRLADDVAKWFYRWVEPGTIVTIRS
jgi:hypothetical protein